MSLREETIKDHRERLNRALIYIQENAGARLSLEALAEIACFSPFHFHRIFAAYVGETLNSYIRRTRLENAAVKLVFSKEPVTSIAMSAGYETPAAFAKAFRMHFGKSPTEFKAAKKFEAPVRLLDLNSAIKEEITMKPEIRDLPEQKVLFVRKTGRYDKAAAEAWGVLMKFTYSRGLMNYASAGIGICHDDPAITPEEKIRYDACIALKKDVEPEGEVGVQKIAGGRYAVFLHKGPFDKLAQTYNAIFSGWLPESKVKLRNVPCFEIYLNRDPRRTKPENLRTEVCIPIE